MFLAEVVPPVGPVFVPALAGLFILAALFFAIGLLKLIDAVARAFFGTISGAIGWIPYAGSVVSHSLHKIEQKISHLIGTAELQLDGYAAWTWHNMAALVKWMGHETADVSVTTWHLAQQARHFLMARETYHAIHTATKPLHVATKQAEHAIANEHARTSSLHHSVAQGVYPRLRQAENEITHVLEPDIAALRARTKAIEHGAVRTWDWIRAHPGTLAATAFAGAVAVALNKLGGGWIRCRNWRGIGKAVCGLPWQLIEGLLGLGLAFAVVIDPLKTAHLAVDAEDAMESIIRKIAD